jgi:hypothetical protein
MPRGGGNTLSQAAKKLPGKVVGVLPKAVKDRHAQLLGKDKKPEDRAEPAPAPAPAAAPADKDQSLEELRATLRFIKAKDVGHYNILKKFSIDGDRAEMKTAYNAFSRAYHPDKADSRGDSPEVKQVKSEIFSIVSNSFRIMRGGRRRTRRSRRRRNTRRRS